MKITISKINKFEGFFKWLIENTTAAKLIYACNNVSKKMNIIAEQYNEKVSDSEIDFASTDEKGNILFDLKGKPLFTKDNFRAFKAKVKELQREEYEIEPSICTDIPLELLEDQIEMFKGLVISEDYKNPVRTELTVE